MKLKIYVSIKNSVFQYFHSCKSQNQTKTCSEVLFFLLYRQLQKLKRRGSNPQQHKYPSHSCFNTHAATELPQCSRFASFHPIFSCSPSLIYPRAAMLADSIPWSPSPLPLSCWTTGQPSQFPQLLSHHLHSTLPLSTVTFARSTFLTCLHRIKPTPTPLLGPSRSGPDFLVVMTLISFLELLSYLIHSSCTKSFRILDFRTSNTPISLRKPSRATPFPFHHTLIHVQSRPQQKHHSEKFSCYTGSFYCATKDFA